jgi:hypothetical protein
VKNVDDVIYHKDLVSMDLKSFSQDLKTLNPNSRKYHPISTQQTPVGPWV